MRKSKVLITGATAQQYSLGAASKSKSFANTLKLALEHGGHEVWFAGPSVDWSPQFLAQYDQVFIGIAPVMSVTSNAAYGALAAIDLLWDSENMTMFSDTPEPWKIFANLRAIERDENALFKPFYSRRPSYSKMKQGTLEKDRVLSAVEKLQSSEWRRVIYPTLPWKMSDLPGVPDNLKSSFIPVNIDSFCIDERVSHNSDRQRRWIVDNEDSRWTKDTMSSLSLPCESLKSLKLKSSDDITDVLRSCLGVLIGPHADKNLWWTPRFSQAINACTPVATDWKISGSIGDSWNHLAAGIEEMSAIDRYELAVTQRIDYLSSIPTKEETVSQLQEITGMK